MLKRRRKISLAKVSIICLTAIILAFAIGFTPPVKADGAVEVVIDSRPEMPEVVLEELKDIFSDTLSSVLFPEDSQVNILESNIETVAEAIRTGTNIVIESKGYTVAELTIDPNVSPVRATFVVRPVGGVPTNPGTVGSVLVKLNPDGFNEFWLQRFTKRIESHYPEFHGIFGSYLIGLPLNASDDRWALSLVMPKIIELDPLKDLFPDFEITYSVDLRPSAIVTIDLRAKDSPIEAIRPRMYSRTVLNVVLDRFREHLITDANFLLGMPRSEVASVTDEASELIAQSLEQSGLARKIDANVSIEVVLVKDEPVVMIDTKVESRLYDTGVETYIDFGNRETDSTEIRTRIGVFVARGIETFGNFEYFTNESILDTDIGLGCQPTENTFIAVAYDTKRKAPKYFMNIRITSALGAQAEIFENHHLTVYELTWQFQQYVSAAICTDGINKVWVRGIFAL